jgi:hypothetical protein
MHTFSKTYTTTVVDHVHGFGLMVGTVPPHAFCGAPPRDIEDVCKALGLRVRLRYAQMREAPLLATLAALVLYDGAALVLERVDNLLATARDPLVALDPTLRAFVTDFAESGMIPVGEKAKDHDVAELITSEATAVAMSERTEGGDAVLLALIGLGTVVTVAPAGRGGPALAGRIAQWIAPRSVEEDSRNG